MSGEEEGEAAEDSASAAEDDSEVACISHLPRSDAAAAATRDFVEEELACVDRSKSEIQTDER